MALRERSFTVREDRNTRVLNSPVFVSAAYHPSSGDPHPPVRQYQAIWDTGATGTFISQRIVDECGFMPLGVTNATHLGGTEFVNWYLINVILPMKVGLSNLKVVGCKKISGGDMLIGMDVIEQGDFAVTHSDGKTTFSFRMPSRECIDFVAQGKKDQPFVDSSRTVGRNSPCPCGSGQKYKRCHGAR